MLLDEILDGQLWLGPVSVPADDVKKVGITHVVNVTPSPSFLGQCTYLHIPIVDKSDVPIDKVYEILSPRRGHKQLTKEIHFEETFIFIDTAIRSGGRVYVHCVAGVSRSTTIVLYYLMRSKSMPLKDAFQHVRERRPVVRPNLGFWLRLCDVEKRLLGQVSVAVDEYMITYMDEVLEIDEGTVRAKLQEHQGDVLAAERAIYVDKFGAFIAKLMFS